MAGYANVIGRADLTDVLVPDQVIKEVIQTDPKESVLLTRARRVPLSSKKAKQPVLDTLPDAYWVDGDSGMKQTTKAIWGQTSIAAEELAVIVPIPNAVVDDAGIPLWDEVKPLLREAIGAKVDAAGIFGDDKPASWPAAIIPGAIAAGNVVQSDPATADLGVDIANVGRGVAQDGFAVSGFLAEPGAGWFVRGIRDSNGRPIYTDPTETSGPRLYGFSLDEVTTGGWDPEVATIVGVDWTKVIVGVRQDVTFDLFSEGVISDDAGKVVLNLMQQDSKALRVVMRVGFTVANPNTRVNPNNATRYPAGVVTPAATP